MNRYTGETVKLTSEELGSINEASNQPKFLQIADRLRELIDCGRLSLGDRLPSVNEIIAHFSVSRDTAVKAYQELKDRGLIEATPNKACFVSNTLLTDAPPRILFLADSMSPFKERLYFGLIDSLPSGYYVDIYTHGDDFDTLRTIYEKYRAMRNCAAMMIIPTSAQNREYEYFRYVNPGNLLFLDRRVSGLRHPAVWQDFRHGFHSALVAQTAILSRYTRLVFLTKFYTNPIIEEMKEGLSRFAAGARIPFHQLRAPFTDRDAAAVIQPEAGDVYFILDDHLLSQLLQACEARNLRVGPDVGAVAINEGPLYPALKVPVSVLSADFYALGAEAAGFIANGSVPAAPVETRLTVRASLLP